MKKFKNLALIIMAGAILIGTSACAPKVEAPANNAQETSAVVENSVEEKTEGEVKSQVENEYTFENNEYLVGTNWLAENLEAEDLVIIDARGDKAYKSGHIKGAISVAWQGLSEMVGQPGDANWGIVGADKESLATKIGALGINNDKKVIIYAAAQNGWGDDGRVMWTLEKAGLKNVRMLDGGMDYWTKQAKVDVERADKYEASKEMNEAVAVEFTIDAIEEDANIDFNELKTNYEKYTIIDTREEDEYTGSQKYGEARGGHLPGAKLVQFSGLFQENGLLKEKIELENYFANDLKLQKQDQIVTYCTAGIRSAHMQLILEMLGYENVQNYDGSYYEWAGNDKTEVEK